MSKILLNILCFSLFISIDKADLFQSINNKTWFETEEFAGASIVFYETATKLKKAIRQIQGSGVYITSSEIYDVKLDGNKLILFNGLNLISSEKLADINYFYDKEKEIITKNNKPLEVYTEELILYDWKNLPNYTGKRIDLNKLKKITIEKNSIYDWKDLDVSVKK